jgi:hypothetical protein
VAGIAVLGALVVAYRSLSSGAWPDNLTRVIAPGTAEMTLAHPGTYTISYEHRNVGTPSGDVPARVSSMRLELVSTSSGARVPVHAFAGGALYVDETTASGPTAGVAIAEFTIDHPGRYALISRYARGQSGQVAIAVGPGSQDDVFLPFLGLVAAGALSLGGLGIVGITFSRRARCARLLKRVAADAFDPVVIEVWRGLGRVQALNQRLPKEARGKVAAIIGKILWLLPSAKRLPISRELFVLRQAATEYLPTSIETYLALPASFATTAVLHDGKTAVQVLWEQLDLLDVKMDEITDAVRSGDRFGAPPIPR